MIRKLFRQKPHRDVPQGCIPAGERVYAVGDIHGCLDLLDQLLGQIAQDDEQRGAARTTLIFLGDLIDRGPQSAGVVNRLADLRDVRPSSRFLLGNHEEVFLTALGGDLKALRFFSRIGGTETIQSYGVDAAALARADFPQLMEIMQSVVPKRHNTFLESFEDMVVIGDYAFVHAGVRPDVPLAEQKVSDLRWIREDFLDHRGALEKVIVHGHTITEVVEEREHRIGLDTGAFSSGKLTAMGFENTERWTLATV